MSCRNANAALCGNVRDCGEPNASDAIERVEQLEHMSGEELSGLPPLDRDIPQARAEDASVGEETRSGTFSGPWNRNLTSRRCWT